MATCTLRELPPRGAYGNWLSNGSRCTRLPGHQAEDSSTIQHRQNDVILSPLLENETRCTSSPAVRRLRSVVQTVRWSCSAVGTKSRDVKRPTSFLTLRIYPSSPSRAPRAFSEQDLSTPDLCILSDRHPPTSSVAFLLRETGITGTVGLYTFQCVSYY